MLVTNVTNHCFVLSAGVVIRPSVVDHEVSDTTYQTDSTLNQQIDALESETFITITSKPSDPFPTTTLEPPVVIATDVDLETPLSVHGTGDGSTALVALFNDDWDSDPNDPTLAFYTGDDGFATLMATTGIEIRATYAIKVRSGGIVFHTPLSVPADGLIGNSEFTLWLDATPGATKLMIKAKDSGGTVRTAAVSLT